MADFPVFGVALEREAAQSLADALARSETLHEPGERDRHRERLEHAIDQATRALAALTGGGEEGSLETIAGARATLARAHAARAEDARHGAGQLSLSAQRAPTHEACEDGWQRVEAIVIGAETSARAAAAMAAELEQATSRSPVARAARRAAEKAELAARAARRIVDERNHAYTFHTDGGFSFGEGWYVAAAAVLANAAIQIEPGNPATPQAERFVREADLSQCLQPYRPRPRAVKQTTEIVARAFRADPFAAQRTLRSAFLGAEPIPTPVIAWADRKLSAADERKKVLLWVRDGVHDAERNTTFGELAELVRRSSEAGLVPILIGDAIHDGEVPSVAADMTLFWKEPIFGGERARRAQLQLFERLKEAHGVVGQLGVTTAGMDGPALMGLPTLYLTDAPNVRMRAWIGAVPGYREIVRERGYLERVSIALRDWAEHVTSRCV